MSEAEEYLKAKVDGGMEIDTNMKAENIAFIIGCLLTMLKKKGLGTQREIADAILETNRVLTILENDGI